MALAHMLMADFRHSNDANCLKRIKIETAHMNDLVLQQDTKNQGWWFWPEPIRKRQPAALAAAVELHKDDIERFIALQFLFDRQWKAVKVRLTICQNLQLPAACLCVILS